MNGKPRLTVTGMSILVCATCTTFLLPNITKKHHQHYPTIILAVLYFFVLRYHSTGSFSLNLKWSGKRDSNCRHEDFQSSALPTELSRQVVEKWRPRSDLKLRPPPWQGGILTTKLLGHISMLREQLLHNNIFFLLLQ